MSIFSKVGGFFGVLFNDLKELFQKAEEKLLPEAIIITQDVNAALNSGLVEDVVAAISPKLAGIPAGILTAAQALVPKVLAAELGLQALQSGATPQDAANWAQNAISSFAGKNFTAQTKVYTNLAAELAVLFDQGKTADKTWADWVGTADQAFKKIQAAVAAAHAAIAPAASASSAPATE